MLPALHPSEHLSVVVIPSEPLFVSRLTDGVEIELGYLYSGPLVR